MVCTFLSIPLCLLVLSRKKCVSLIQELSNISNRTGILANRLQSHTMGPRRSHPLGLFHSTPWLSKHHVNPANYKNIVLITPPLCDIVTRYPIPLSVVEDAQQIEFWEVGVRKFGHKLLRTRRFHWGIKVSTNGEETRTNALPDFFAYADVRSANAKFKYKSLLELSPDKRRLKVILENMIEGGNAQRNFVEKSQEHNNTKEQLSSLVTQENASSVASWDPQVDEAIRTNIVNAVSEHLELVKLLHQTEEYAKQKH